MAIKIMRETIKKLKRYSRIIRFHFSHEKKILDSYMNAILNLEPLSDTDWKLFRDIAQKRKEIYSNT